MTSLCLLVALLAGGDALAAKSSSAASLKALVRQTNSLPRSVVSNTQRRKLLGAAKHAQRVAKKRPCVAVKDLGRFRRILGKVKVKRARRFRVANVKLAALGPASLKASGKLLTSRSTRRCGGGVPPSTRSNPRTKVLQSDENGMHLQIQLPQLNFVPETAGGQTWTRLAMANTDTPGTPGKPAIPVISKTFGVPDGATVSVKTNTTTSYTLSGVNVFPAQPDPVDLGSSDPAPNIFAPPFTSKPFTEDGQAYASDRFFPAAPASGNFLGTSGVLNVGSLQIPAAQYNPLTQTLRVFNTVNVTINFNGGPHTFSDLLGSPWDLLQRRLLTSFLNFDFLRSRFNPIVLRPCGEQMLVITNSSTAAAATTLANARNAAGIRTVVVQTGAGATQIGTTATAIQTYIRSQLTALRCIHPSYVTIMGDDELVPTFTATPGAIPSDLQYSMKDDADELPDVAVGRILGQDLTQLNTEVAKIVNYENNPPTSFSFLHKALVAAQFQDDNGTGQETRTFVQFAETVRNGLTARGVAVDRVYTDVPTATPLKFNDGTDLPAALKKPTFAWNGTGADVTAGWNAGRFLVVHRDHGWSDGWANPGFGTADAEALTNGSLLPVVLSINCSSAAYDYDETSFTQQALANANGGAVGVFGDTRDSPTWHNSQIALGFVDALLPSVLPAEGPATKQRMGDALINGKLRLAGLAPPSGPGITGGDGNTRSELYLWHYFGDPSMQMWGGDPPRLFTAGEFSAIYRARNAGPSDPPYEVNVTGPRELAGQAISLLRGNQVVGTATVNGDGTATIPAAFGDGSVKPGDLRIAVEPDGGKPISAPVDGVPRLTTTLTQSCPTIVDANNTMTITGNLAPAPAGSQVDVKFTPPITAGSAESTQHPVTDAQGNWSAQVTPAGDDIGDWTVSSSYAGTSQYAPSQGGPCTVYVNSP